MARKNQTQRYMFVVSCPFDRVTHIIVESDSAIHAWDNAIGYMHNEIGCYNFRIKTFADDAVIVTEMPENTHNLRNNDRAWFVWRSHK